MRLHRRRSILQESGTSSSVHIQVMEFKRGDLIGSGLLAERNPAWTATAVKKFLGDADKLITHPAFGTAGKMWLYLISRVETVEATPEWDNWVAANRRRSAASGKCTADPKLRSFTGYGRTGKYRISWPAGPARTVQVWAVGRRCARGRCLGRSRGIWWRTLVQTMGCVQRLDRWSRCH
ncbi:hypothetical protein SAMN04487914_11340 [Arthrobacter sp. ok909]|nr:hypothetical protein SAMN04487914_11340 [Arthrobacter sp. ok909]